MTRPNEARAHTRQTELGLCQSRTSNEAGRFNWLKPKSSQAGSCVIHLDPASGVSCSARRERNDYPLSNPDSRVACATGRRMVSAGAPCGSFRSHRPFGLWDERVVGSQQGTDPPAASAFDGSATPLWPAVPAKAPQSSPPDWDVGECPSTAPVESPTQGALSLDPPTR